MAAIPNILLEMNNDSTKSLEIMSKNEIELQERQSIASSISPNSSGNQQDDSMENAEQMEVSEKADNEIGFMRGSQFQAVLHLILLETNRMIQTMMLDKSMLQKVKICH